MSGTNELSRNVIADAVAFINNVATRSALDAAITIGEYMLANVFTGAVDKGNVTYRAVASSPGLKVSASYLWTAVTVAGYALRWPPETLTALPLSHHRLLACVPDEDRLPLAEEARAGAWGKRELEQRIKGAAVVPFRNSVSNAARNALADIAEALCIPPGKCGPVPESLDDVKAIRRLILDAIKGQSGRKRRDPFDQRKVAA